MSTNPIKPAAPNGKALLQNGEANRLRKAAARWRNLHLVSAFVVAAWLLMMTATGVVVNHQTDWGLDEVEVRNTFLPGHYTTEFSPDSTRLNVVVTDLHSGRLFWEQGKLITDAIGLLVFLSVFSGFYAFRLRKKVVRLCREICDLNCSESVKELEAIPAPTGGSWERLANPMAPRDIGRDLNPQEGAPDLTENPEEEIKIAQVR